METCRNYGSAAHIAPAHDGMTPIKQHPTIAAGRVAVPSNGSEERANIQRTVSNNANYIAVPVVQLPLQAGFARQTWSTTPGRIDKCAHEFLSLHDPELALFLPAEQFDLEKLPKVGPSCD